MSGGKSILNSESYRGRFKPSLPALFTCWSGSTIPVLYLEFLLHTVLESWHFHRLTSLVLGESKYCNIPLFLLIALSSSWSSDLTTFVRATGSVKVCQTMKFSAAASLYYLNFPSDCFHRKLNSLYSISWLCLLSKIFSCRLLPTSYPQWAGYWWNWAPAFNCFIYHLFPLQPHRMIWFCERLRPSIPHRFFACLWGDVGGSQVHL